MDDAISAGSGVTAAEFAAFAGPLNQAELSSSQLALPKSFPGIAQALYLSVLFYGMTLAVVVMLPSISRFAGVSLDLFSSLLVLQVIAWPLILWVGLRRGKVSFGNAFPLTRFPVRAVPALFTAAFGATILLLAVTSWIPMTEAFRGLMAEAARSNKLALFFSAVLAAPLGEELFFRGLVLRGFLSRYSIAKAVWASAVLFAIFHLNRWQAVVALPLGLAFAWLFLRTGSLIPGIIAHATVNFSASFLIPPLALLLGHDTYVKGNFPGAVLLIGAVTAGMGGFFLWRQLLRLSNEQGA